MIGQQHPAKAVQRGIDRGSLRQNVGTVSVFIQHPLQTANLAFYPLQAVHKVAALVFIPNLFPLRSTVSFFRRMHHHLSHSNTLMGYPIFKHSIYPVGV